MKYEKQFLIDCFIWRYTDVLLKITNFELDQFVDMVYNYYCSVDKATFRSACSLDADEIRKFRLATGQ